MLILLWTRCSTVLLIFVLCGELNSVVCGKQDVEKIPNFMDGTPTTSMSDLQEVPDNNSDVLNRAVVFTNDKKRKENSSVLSVFLNSMKDAFNTDWLKKNWWQGENVCKVKEVFVKQDSDSKSEGTSLLFLFSFLFSTAKPECRQTESNYICTSKLLNDGMITKVVTIYQCCHGFKKSGDRCVKAEVYNLFYLLADTGAIETAAFILGSDLKDIITLQNLTLFIPSDNALHGIPNTSNQTRVAGEVYDDSSSELSSLPTNTSLSYVLNSESNDSSTPNSSDYLEDSDPDYNGAIYSKQLLELSKSLQDSPVDRELVLSHITKGFYETGDFYSEKVVISEDEVNSTLRLNRYSVESDGETLAVYTVNCAVVVKTDFLTDNATVHILDRVQPRADKTLAQLLDQPQFSILKQLLNVTEILPELCEKGSTTLFAPTNEAFEEFNEIRLKKYYDGSGCIKDILHQHMLGSTMCTAAAKAENIYVMNELLDWIHVERCNGDELWLNNVSRITGSDIVATNGVLHTIDKIFIPDIALPLADSLVVYNHTTWLDLVAKAGLLELLEMSQNVTLFVPSEEVLNSLTTQKMLHDMPLEALSNIIKYHIVTPQLRFYDLKDDEFLETKLNNKTIMVGMYDRLDMESQTTVQCGVVSEFYYEMGCNTITHSIDKILIPSKGSILDTLRSIDNFSFLTKIIQGTKIEAELAVGMEGGITLLAPTDNEFIKLKEKYIKKLLDDKEYADQTIRNHIIIEPICCAGIGKEVFPFISMVETLSSSTLIIKRIESQVMFGTIKVTECDIVADDGIIHVVDQVMLPSLTAVDRKIMDSSFLLYAI